MSIEWHQLIKERDDWVAHNFPNRHIPDPGESIMGMIEELGELTHAELKQAQNIRGTPEEHDAEMKDAIGDLTIYMLGVMSWARHHYVYPKAPVSVKPIFRLAALMGRFAENYLLDVGPRWYGYYIDEVVSALNGICEARGWSYEEIVNETWNNVSQRDWIQDSSTGGEAA